MVFNLLFEMLRKRLAEQVPELAEIRWEAQQAEGQRGEMAVSPLATVRFMEMQMADFLQSGVQYGIAEFEVRLLTDHLGADDGARLLSHYAMAGKINKALAGFSAGLSYLDYESNEPICGTISRSATAPEHRPSAIISTTARFKCFAYDYSGSNVFDLIASPDVAITPSVSEP